MEEGEGILIIAASEGDANLYYATRFLAPDPFAFLWTAKEKLLLLSDLELDRGRSQAAVDGVLSLSKYEGEARSRGVERPGLLDSLDPVLREREIRRLIVPANFGLEHADGLRRRGYAVEARPDPFFPERLVKSEREVQWILEAERRTEAAMDVAIQAIGGAEIRGDSLYRDGRPLTAEGVRKIIARELLDRDCVAQHTIVACGAEGCDPHNQGSGPLRPHQPIIIDIFPRAVDSRYFADITRTVARGKAPEKVGRMFEAVLAGQQRALGLIADGAEGSAIHAEVVATLEGFGFATGEIDGRMQGFFHGTGHGLGLEVHEPPRISKVPATLRAGNVVTVEPGLYYAGIGGVRIEDLVVVTPNGCKNLTTYPKELEI